MQNHQYLFLASVRAMAGICDPEAEAREIMKQDSDLGDLRLATFVVSSNLAERQNLERDLDFSKGFACPRGLVASHSATGTYIYKYI